MWCIQIISWQVLWRHEGGEFRSLVGKYYGGMNVVNSDH